MKKRLFYIVALSMFGVLTMGACGGDDGNDEPQKKTDTTEGDKKTDSGKTDTPTETTTFAKGADISWVTEMEADGKKFYNSAGTETDLFALMKSIGMNAVRLRVWVNPEEAAVADATSGGYGAAYCDKTDVVNKAKRAKDAGLDVMIDFHYSNVFADPSRQNTPTQWKGHSLEQLKTDVANHTTEVLKALKDAGVTPKWIQIGNEITSGMLFSTGYIWKTAGDKYGSWDNLVELFNAGYKAAKDVFADATIIAHIDNAYKDNDWWFKRFKENGGEFDMIGLSHYPMANEEMTWSAMNTAAIANIKSLAKTYNCKVMVCEVGVKPAQTDAAKCMSDFMAAAKGLDVCAGVFYWEPEVYGSWRPKTYLNTWGWDSYDMGAFDNNGKPMSILDSFK